MLKKSLIGLLVVALAGGGYWYYDDYQKKEKVRLIKERKEYIVRTLEKQKEDNIQKEKERKVQALREAEEEVARQKRIAEGNPIIEEIVTYDPDTKQKKEQYTLIEGKKEGLEIVWNHEGNKKKESYYKNGKLHGIQKNYCESTKEGGLISENNYADGLKDGRQISYAGCGNINIRQEDFYQAGQRHGSHKVWSKENGALITEAFYQNGEAVGEAFSTLRYRHYILTYKNGIVAKVEAKYLTGEKATEIVRDDSQDFIWFVREWYKNGVISHEGETTGVSLFNIKGYRTDRQIYYNLNGKKFLEIDISGDRPNGWCRRWDEEGKLITELFTTRKGLDTTKSYFGDENNCYLSKIELKQLNTGE